MGGPLMACTIHSMEIRPPLLPHLRCSSSVDSYPNFALFAPCRTRGSAPSISQRTHDAGHPPYPPQRSVHRRLIDRRRRALGEIRAVVAETTSEATGAYALPSLPTGVYEDTERVTVADEISSTATFASSKSCRFARVVVPGIHPWWESWSLGIGRG